MSLSMRPLQGDRSPVKKPQKILLASVVCVLAVGAAAAVAGPTVYRNFFATPAVDAPTLVGDPSLTDDSIDPPSDTPLDPAELAGAWTVSDGSEAGYRVDEVLNGTDVTVTGRTPEVTGSLAISEDGLTLDSAEISVDVASISTDRDQRDAYFRDQAVHVAENPDATFVLTTPVTADALPNTNEVINVDAQGELTIAGVTKSVTAAIQVRSDGSTTEVAGSIPITFSDFGIQAPSLGFVKVEDSGFVEFQLVAVKG